MPEQVPEGGYGSMGLRGWFRDLGNATALMILVAFFAVIYWDNRNERRNRDAATAEHGKDATKAITESTQAVNNVNSTMQMNAKEVGEMRQTLQRMEWQGKLQGVPWLGGGKDKE